MAWLKIHRLGYIRAAGNQLSVVASACDGLAYFDHPPRHCRGGDYLKICHQEAPIESTQTFLPHDLLSIDGVPA